MQVAKRKYAKRKAPKLPPRHSKRMMIHPYLLPDKFICDMKYASEFTLDPSNDDVIVSQIYAANDVYDPDISGGGHSALGFDQFMVFFKHFHVISSKIVVTPVIAGTANVIPFIWGVNVTASSGDVGGSDILELLEQQSCKTHRYAGTLQTTGNPYTDGAIKKKFNTKKFFNLSESIPDREYWGSSTGAPTDLGYYSIWAGCIGGTQPGAVYFHAVITYTVQFHECASLDKS